MRKKWTEIQKILENSLGSGQVKVWIAPLDPLWDETGLTLFAPTEFAAAHIRARLLPAVQAALGQVCEEPCVVRVCVGKGNAVKCTALALAETSAAAPSAATPAATEHTTALVPDKRPCPRSISPLQLGLPGTASSGQHTSNHVWRFSFEDFVVGPSNELAYAASKGLSSGALHTDILFLCSAPGLGKTHLMHAVGKSLFAACNHSRPKAEYLTAEEFTSRFYSAIKSQETGAFKARYREADLLLLEDVHFLQGKEKTQDELLATIKAVRDRGGKVVFSSSFAPRELKQMNEQLVSRLGAGLVSSIERPNEETRRRIFRSKASLHQVLLPEDVEDMLARYISKDVRQIESCLQTLILKARMLNSRITPEMAWEVLSQYAASTPVLDMDAIIDSICRAFALTPEQLASAVRKQECVLARNTAFFLARKHTDLSLEQIGRHFNRRHSTVLKGISNVEREIRIQSPQGCRIERTMQLIEKNGNLLA